MSVTTIQIKNPLGKVLFEHTAENNSIAKTIGAAKAAERSLPCADFRGAVMENINFSEMDLQYAFFRGAILRSCIFDGADLRDADFFGTNIFDSSFADAKLNRALLCYSILQKVNFSYASLINARLEFSCLMGSKFYQAKIGKKLTLCGDDPIFQIAPIGDCALPLIVYMTNDGAYVQYGSYFGSASNFDVQNLSQENVAEMRAARKLIKARVRHRWLPKTTASEAA